MKRSLAIALCALLPACAAHRPSPAREGFSRVVVVLASSAERPGMSSLVDGLTGTEDPLEALGREAERLLQAHGYSAISCLRVDAVPPPEHLRRLIAREGAQGAVVINLARLDLTALRALGRTEVDLEARLHRADGASVWSHAQRGATQVTTYRARFDWRPHLRDALARALRGLP